MLLSVKMYLNSLKERRTSGSRSKQRRDRLLERRRSAGSLLSIPQIFKSARSVSCFVAPETEISHMPEGLNKFKRLYEHYNF